MNSAALLGQNWTAPRSMADDAALPALLALPAPEDASSSITLDCATGQPVTLDHLGPVVVNTDGTLSRITNWEAMDDNEQKVCVRRSCRREIPVDLLILAGGWEEDVTKRLPPWVCVPVTISVSPDRFHKG